MVRIRGVLRRPVKSAGKITLAGAKAGGGFVKRRIQESAEERRKKGAARREFRIAVEKEKTKLAPMYAKAELKRDIAQRRRTGGGLRGMIDIQQGFANITGSPLPARVRAKKTKARKHKKIKKRKKK